jgi:hypothetical protein
MTTAEKNLHSEQACDIFKLLVAKGTTDWDFAPLAAKACDAVEVFHEVARQRYPTNVVGEPAPVAESSQQQPPPAPGVATLWGT